MIASDRQDVEHVVLCAVAEGEEEQSDSGEFGADLVVEQGEARHDEGNEEDEEGEDQCYQ